MPELTLQLDGTITRKILDSLELAFKNDPKNQKLTDYWESYKSLIQIKPLGNDEVQLSGESGFYFPGSSYNRLDWVNTLLKLVRMPKLKTSGRSQKLAALARMELPKGFGYRFGSRRVSFDFLRAKYHAYCILDAWEENKISIPDNPIFLEIGSGTGIQAYVFSLLFPNLTYICIDLPETLSMCSFFLSKARPKQRFFFYKDWLEQGAQLPPGGGRFLFLPHYEISGLPSESVDLIINTDSMQEMSYETIAFYFKEIRRLLRSNRMFYQSNRVSKNMGPEVIKVENYPFLPQDKHLFHRINPFMTRQLQMRTVRGKYTLPLLNVHRPHIQSLTRMS